MRKTYHVFDNGLKIFNHHIIAAQKERYRQCNVHEAEEEKYFIEQIESIRHGGIYVNIGAAVGYYAILSKMTRKDIAVHAYEPLDTHRRYMAENIILNGLKKGVIKIFSEAIYVKNGYANIFRNNYSSSITTERNNKYFLNRIWRLISNKLVKTIALDVVVKRAGGIVDLLQMDIQGQELSVLESSMKSLFSHNIKRLIIGTHSIFIHRECAKILTDAGYRLSVDCYNTKLQPDDILIGEI